MKKILLISLTLTLSLNLFSQINMEAHDMPTYHWKEFKEADSNFNDYIGSPYVFKEFMSGEVYFKGKTEPVEYKLNYNAYQDVIEFLSDQKQYTVTNSEDIDKIIVNEQTILFLTSDKTKGFFFEIIKDDFGLYKKEMIKFIEPRDARNIYDDNEPARFLKDDPEFYISINNKLEYIKNKKSFLKLFDNNTELSDFIKNSNINFKEKKDLIKLIKFINASEIKS